MPTYLIVRCFSCSTYQIEQQKKIKKWSCKICGSKQSFIKIFGVADKGSLLRPKVQELNMNRGLTEEAKEEEQESEENIIIDERTEDEKYEEIVNRAELYDMLDRLESKKKRELEANKKKFNADENDEQQHELLNGIKLITGNQIDEHLRKRKRPKTSSKKSPYEQIQINPTTTTTTTNYNFISKPTNNNFKLNNTNKLSTSSIMELLSSAKNDDNNNNNNNRNNNNNNNNDVDEINTSNNNDLGYVDDNDDVIEESTDDFGFTISL